MEKLTGRQPEQKQKKHAYGLTGVSRKALDFIAPIKKNYEDRAIDRLLVSFGY
jgi:hypothetical protein